METEAGSVRVCAGVPEEGKEGDGGGDGVG